MIQLRRADLQTYPCSEAIPKSKVFRSSHPTEKFRKYETGDIVFCRLPLMKTIHIYGGSMTHMLTICTIIGVLFSAQPIFAQITLTRSDVEPWLGKKSMSEYSATGVGGTKVNIGSTGAGQSFNFSTLTYDNPLIIPTETVAPSTTPYGAEFPTATHAQRTDYQGAESFTYMRLADNGLFYLGIGTTNMGQTLIIKRNPEEPEFMFPCTLNTNWNYDGSEVEMTQGVFMKERTSVTVDASGNLKVPGFDVSALRLKHVTFITMRVEIAGQVISETVTKKVQYTFVTKLGISASVSIDTLDENSSNPKVENLSYSVFEGTQTSVDRIEDRSFRFVSAYPNPVSGQTGYYATVSWSQEREASATLDLLDLAGRNIMRIHEGSGTGRQTVTFGTQGVESGVYMLRLSVGNASRTRLLTVVK